MHSLWVGTHNILQELGEGVLLYEVAFARKFEHLRSELSSYFGELVLRDKRVVVAVDNGYVLLILLDLLPLPRFVKVTALLFELDAEIGSTRPDQYRATQL